MTVTEEEHLSWPRQTVVEYHVRVVGLYHPPITYTMLDEDHEKALAECRAMYHTQHRGTAVLGVRARRVAVTYALPPADEDGAVRKQMVKLDEQVIEDEHARGKWE